jgi:flagellar biosynthesis/type III secretory pathway chaperone
MHTPVFEHDTDLLAALVAAKLKILELLAQLARKQLALADRGESTDLLKLLAAKQTVLAQLQHVERRLDPFRSQDPEARVWRSPADRQRCQERANRCDELLAETMRVEKQGEAAMIRRRDQAASVLAGAAAAADAQAAYAGPALAPPVALQLHCEG